MSLSLVNFQRLIDYAIGYFVYDIFFIIYLAFLLFDSLEKAKFFCNKFKLKKKFLDHYLTSKKRGSDLNFYSLKMLGYSIVLGYIAIEYYKEKCKKSHNYLKK